MFRKIIFMIPILLLTASAITLCQQPSSNISMKELSKFPIVSGPLKITIKSFNRAGALGFGNARIEVEVENTSPTDFAVFNPDRLSIVSEDDLQSDVYFTRINFKYVPSITERRIAPKAHILANYYMTDKILFPARIFYDEKLLVTVHD